MMHPMRTQSAPAANLPPKAQLVDDRLRRETGAGLVETVHRLRATDPPTTWTAIAERLSRWADLPVSRQLVQQWHTSWDREAA